MITEAMPNRWIFHLMANIFKLLVTASLIDMPHFLPQKLKLLAIFHIYSQNIVLIENSTAWSWRFKKILCTCQWFWCIKDTLNNKNCTAPGTSVILHFILSMNIVCMSMSSWFNQFQINFCWANFLAILPSTSLY